MKNNNYIPPQAQISDLLPEGVLCGSLDSQLPDYDPSEGAW